MREFTLVAPITVYRFGMTGEANKDGLCPAFARAYAVDSHDLPPLASFTLPVIWLATVTAPRLPRSTTPALAPSESDRPPAGKAAAAAGKPRQPVGETPSPPPL